MRHELGRLQADEAARAERLKVVTRFSYGGCQVGPRAPWVAIPIQLLAKLAHAYFANDIIIHWLATDRLPSSTRDKNRSKWPNWCGTLRIRIQNLTTAGNAASEKMAAAQTEMKN